MCLLIIKIMIDILLYLIPFTVPINIYAIIRRFYWETEAYMYVCVIKTTIIINWSLKKQRNANLFENDPYILLKIHYLISIFYFSPLTSSADSSYDTRVPWV